jgi:hypothetical protein
VGKEDVVNVLQQYYFKEDFAAFIRRKGSIVGEFGKTTPPAGFVFAYDSEARTDETFKDWFTPKNAEDTPSYPSLVGCLDIGLFGFIPPGIENCSASSLPEVGMSAQCMTFPVVRPKDGVTLRASASNFRYLVGSSQGFREKGGVQGRALAFAGDALLVRMLLEQVQRQLAEQGETGRAVAVLDAALVLPETNVQLPMQLILDAPGTVPSK